MFDEPLSNLDAKLRDQMRAEIMNLRQRINATFIYVTHDQIEAMTLGAHIVITKDGLIQQSGTPQDVFNKPKNLFVAGDTGTPQMNFYTAILDISQNQYVIRIQDTVIPVSEQAQKALETLNTKPKDIVLGIRPEHISTDAGDNGNHIRAKIDFTEMMGSEMYLHVRADDSKAIIRVHIYLT